MEIVIKEISNFPHGKVEVKDNGFIVDTSVSKVLVHIQERVDTIFFKKSLEKTWEEISVLHCRDLENHKISLIGCKMKIKGLDSFVILWQTVLYGDYKDGVLSKEEYLYAKNTYQDEVERLRQELREMEEVRRSAGKIADGIQNWSRLVRKYAKTKKVSGEMVRAMIKSITLYADNSISIEFLYMDEFEKIQETCARLRGEVA